MGGFAVAIDWSSPPDPAVVRTMMEQVPHRTAGGVETLAAGPAVLAQGFNLREPRASVVRQGPWSIVGHVRIYDPSALRTAASTRDTSDLGLILAAIRRRGISALDALNGDFGFVVWNEETRAVLAARDRFAVKPLFYAATPSGVRFASEVKQLLIVAEKDPKPDLGSVAEYITYDFREASHTFYEGIRRVRPSYVMTMTAGDVEHHRYWNLEPSTTEHRSTDLPTQFREALTSAVERRIETADSVVSQLSGGIDSPSIAAAAASLVPPLDPGRFITVSMVAPGTAIDESVWIDEIVRSQPFAHRDFTPSFGDVDDLAVDRRIVDGAFVDVIRDMNHATARIAADLGADLVFTGNGGDHLLDQVHVLADTFRTGSIAVGLRRARQSAAWRGGPLGATLSPVVRSLVPESVRRTIRARRNTPIARVPNPETRYDVITGLGSRNQDAMATHLTNPIFSWINEAQESVFATYGVELTHPYLDRDLAEFVLSISPMDLPYDGAPKTLARQAFVDDLPASVIDRRVGTTAERYLDDVLAEQRAELRRRYADPPAAAAAIIDPKVYSAAIGSVDSGQITAGERHRLMRVWLAFEWLEGLQQMG